MAKVQEGRKLSGKTNVKQKTAYCWKGVDVNEVSSGREALGRTGALEGLGTVIWKETAMW